MDVELRHLRAFVAVATNRSFTAAARQLLITQPALTRTIQQLENTLEVRLLDRSSRSVEVTQTGLAFLRRIQGVLSDLDLALAEARGERDLRIGFQWALPDPWATHAIASFEQTTGATATLVRRDDIATALDNGDIDVALVRGSLNRPGVAETTLFEEPRVAAVSTRSPLANRRTVSWLELAEHPLVVNTLSGSTKPDLWPPEHRPTRVVECGNYDEWIALVASDRGVGATPASAARTHAHAGVTFIPLEDAPPVTLRLATVPRRDNALVRRFVEAARDTPMGAVGS